MHNKGKHTIPVILLSILCNGFMLFGQNVDFDMVFRIPRVLDVIVFITFVMDMDL